MRYLKSALFGLLVYLHHWVDLRDVLAKRWKVSPEHVEFATLSGLGSNRLTPRLVVRLLRELSAVCAREGIEVGDILPTAGCDPGTLKNYPRLAEGVLSGNLVAKTGTLTGVSALSGYIGGVATPRFAFSVIFNGIKGSTAPYRALQDELCRTLVARTELVDK